jgi:hypothetical protein
VKLLAIVPDPASAYGLGALLGALSPETTRVVAYGQATAAVLPPGLDVFVYPVRDGTRLPAPFVEALLEHEGADVLLAPTGSVTSTPVPTLLVDLDPRVSPPSLVSGEDPASWTWVEGVTALPERRPVLLRAGLFSVDVLADWFEGPGRLRAGAAPALLARMADLAGLLGRHRETERRAPAPPPRGSAPAGPPMPSDHDKTDLPEFKSISTSSKIVPIEVRSAAALEPSPTGPAGSSGTAVAEIAAPAPPAIAAPAPAVVSQPAEAYRGRHAGGRAVVLASVEGLERIPGTALDGAAILATPETLAAAAGRAEASTYVCLAAPPRDPAVLAALPAAGVVAVLDERLEATELIPAARAAVPLLDLQRAGGPALGWSDDLKVGYFPAGGDAALALQWAHWLGVAEVIVAPPDPAHARPGWSAFLRGARELLEARGVVVTLVEPGAR